ncbi:MAG: hypothetical protein AAF483_24765 [Planctomycetota bacterium]
MSESGKMKRQKQTKDPERPIPKGKAKAGPFGLEFEWEGDISGQIRLFAVLGVIILAVLVAMALLRPFENNQSSTDSNDSDSVESTATSEIVRGTKQRLALGEPITCENGGAVFGTHQTVKESDPTSDAREPSFEFEGLGTLVPERVLEENGEDFKDEFGNTYLRIKIDGSMINRGPGAAGFREEASLVVACNR